MTATITGTPDTLPTPTEGPLGSHFLFAMDQRPDLVELSYLMELMPCNMSDPSSSIYNFSRATAIDLILEYRDEMLTIRAPTTIALLCLYIPTFLFALGGNLLVVYVVFKNPHMRRVKNLFLVNLAVADIFVTVLCIPMVTGQTVYRLWVYGHFMCKLSGYMQGLSVTCSIFTLSALSVDRYLAIKCPMSLKRISGKCQAVRTLVIIWVLSALFAGPILYIRRVNTVEFNCLEIDFSYCIEEWPHARDRQIYGIVVMFIIYVAPLSIVAVCYGLIGKALCSDEFHRKTSDGSATIMLGRKRVARMLIALIVVFVMCWLPYNACSLRLDIKPDIIESQIVPFTLWLGHAHSAINPVLYWFLNKSFRHCMRKVLYCHTGPHSRRASPSPQSEGDIGALFHYKCPPHPPELDIPNEQGMVSLRTRLRMRNSPSWVRREFTNRGRLPNVNTEERPKRDHCVPVELNVRKNPHAPALETVQDKMKQEQGLTGTKPSISKWTGRKMSAKARGHGKDTPSPKLVKVQSPAKEQVLTPAGYTKCQSSLSNDSTQPTSPSSEYIEKYGFCTTHSANV